MARASFGSISIMGVLNRPLPAPDDLSQPFWDAAAQGRLVIQRCIDCGHYNHPPKPLCDRCASANLQYVEVSGRGRVFSFTTNYQKNVAGFEDAVPYTNLIVELEEEPQLFVISDLAGTDTEWVHIGAPVQVVFQTLDEGVSLPQFTQGQPREGTAHVGG
jgi:uncharacterized protein